MITKKKLKYVTPLGNLFAHDEGIDDEYYINEIIGIDELPYDEFVKKPEPKIAVPHIEQKQCNAFLKLGVSRNDRRTI